MGIRNPSARRAAFDASVDRQLGLQLQQSLHSAAKIFTVIYGVSVVAWTALWLLPATPKSNLTAASPSFNFGAGDAYLAIVGLAEALHCLALRSALRSDRRLSPVWVYLLSFLESFQPTFFLFLWGLILPPEQALVQSPLFFYFLLMGAGALRMDAALSLFSGLVAGCSYIGLAFFFHIDAGTANPVKVVTSLHLTEGVYLFMAGVFMAIVSRQTRRRLERSIAASTRAERLEREASDKVRAIEERETIAVMREREAIMQDLHDTVTQKIAWVSLAVEKLRIELSDSASPALLTSLDRIGSVANDAQIDVRDFIHDDRASSVRERGLLPVLSDYFERVRMEHGFGVEFDISSAPDPLPLTTAQAIETLKIIEECVTNSRKHAGAARARIAIEGQGGELVIQIMDEGSGFDPSLPAPASHHGLAIVTRRARAAGGQLLLESSPGKGTRVELRFGKSPLPPSPGKPAAQLADDIDSATRQSKGIDLFVVDDNELFREGLCGLLRLAGFSIVGSTASAKEAIVAIRETRPEIVLLDIQMPELDGIAATALIKEDFPEIRIVLLTASPEAEGVYEALRVGASSYVPKSTPAWRLIETIEEVASGESSLDAAIAARILQDFPISSREDEPNLPERIDILSPRQLEILKLVKAGLTYKEVGARLGVTERTIKWHMASIIQTLQVRNKAEAVRAARAAGL